MTQFSAFTVAGLAFAALALAGCQKPVASVEKTPTLVVTQTVALVDYAAGATLTGEINARTETPLSFRITGRLTERMFDVGDHVSAGQLLARIDPQEQQADIAAAQAAVDAAEAQVQLANSSFERQKSLLDQGITTRSLYDEADAARQTAAGSLTVAEAQLGTARDALTYTELRATAAGIITTRTGEVGEVAAAAQTVYTIAEDGDRDAVFDVQEAVFLLQPDSAGVALNLVSDTSITAKGAVREVAPTLDPQTGTVEVKVSIENAPPEMTLGAAIAGSISAVATPAVILPWSALGSSGGKPIVWVVDPQSLAVAMAPVTVASYQTGLVIIGSGLKAGDVVVTEGTKFLRPQQVVTLAGKASP